MKLYLIGNAHLDPVWLWTENEGAAEVRATFAAAADRVEEYGDFVFTASSAQYYAWVERYDPALFERIRQYVRDGRWCPVGGWWIQPDCNLPSGESLARQSLYGQRYFMEKFGRIARTGYNVDSFGHAATLPQILAKSGLTNYVFSRPAFFEKTLPERFWWRAPDGTAVKAFRIPYGYESNTLDDLTRKLDKYAADENVPAERMLFYGVGNHGGGPTVEMLEYIEGLRERPAGTQYAYASPDDYFADVTPETEVADELERHAVGCYSAHSELKRLHRRCENALLTAEKLSLAAGDPAPLDDAWKTFLFNEFHDALGGCSIYTACEELKTGYGAVLYAASQATMHAAQRLAARTDTLRGLTPIEAAEQLGKPYVVFNPLAFPVRADVRVRRLITGDAQYAVTDGQKEIGRVQATACENLFPDMYDGLFRVEVPAYGYTTVFVRPAKTRPENAVRAYREDNRVPYRSLTPVYGRYVLENEFLRAEIHSVTGRLTRLYDKRTQTELLRAETALTVYDDRDNDTWAHDVSEGAHIRNNELDVWSHCREDLGPKTGAADRVHIEITECGCVRGAIECRSTFGQSAVTETYILNADSAALDITVTVDWHERCKTLRAEFPTVYPSDADYEIPFGRIMRASDGKENFAHNRVTVGDGTQALSLLNDGKYSFSCMDGTLRVVAARSALYADHGGFRTGKERLLDMGQQTFRLALLPHAAGDVITPLRYGLALNTEFPVVPEGYHAGGADESFIDVSADNVVVTAVKGAADGRGFVARLVEAEGRAADCRLTLFGRACRLTFAPYEIKTIRFGQTIEETDIPELHVTAKIQEEKKNV